MTIRFGTDCDCAGRKWTTRNAAPLGRTGRPEPHSASDALAAYGTMAPTSPTQFYRATQPRVGLYDSASDSGSVALTTQVMTSVPLLLAMGDVVTNLSFVSGATAAGTPTNWWFALYDLSATPALIAQTADQTSTAWAAFTAQTKALTAAYTVPKTGVYWAAIHVKATTVPSLLGSIGVKPVSTMKVRNADNSAIATANGTSHRRRDQPSGSAIDGSNWFAEVSAVVI